MIARAVAAVAVSQKRSQPECRITCLRLPNRNYRSCLFCNVGLVEGLFFGLEDLLL
jgi:hypothetical protein